MTTEITSDLRKELLSQAMDSDLPSERNPFVHFPNLGINVIVFDAKRDIDEQVKVSAANVRRVISEGELILAVANLPELDFDDPIHDQIMLGEDRVAVMLEGLTSQSVENVSMLVEARQKERRLEALPPDLRARFQEGI